MSPPGKKRGRTTWPSQETATGRRHQGRRDRAVVPFVEPGVREVPSEDVVNELRGGAAARAVGEVDGAVLHVEGAHVKVGHGSSFFLYR